MQPGKDELFISPCQVQRANTQDTKNLATKTKRLILHKNMFLFLDEFAQ